MSVSSYRLAIQNCHVLRNPSPYLIIRSAICLSPFVIISWMSETSICPFLKFCLTYIFPFWSALHLIVELRVKYLQRLCRANLPSLYHIKCLKYSAGLISLTRSEQRSPLPCGYSVGNALTMYPGVWNSFIGFPFISGHSEGLLWFCIR